MSAHRRAEFARQGGDLSCQILHQIGPRPGCRKTYLPGQPPSARMKNAEGRAHQTEAREKSAAARKPHSGENLVRMGLACTTPMNERYRVYQNQPRNLLWMGMRKCPDQQAAKGMTHENEGSDEPALAQ